MGDTGTQQMAIDSLRSACNNADVRLAVAQHLPNENLPLVRAGMIDAIHTYVREPDIQSVVVGRLRDIDPDVRFSAARALRAVAAQVADALVNRLTQEQVSRVRVAILDALEPASNQPDVINAHSRVLEEEGGDASEQQVAMRALFSRPDLAASEPPSPATNLRLIEDEGQRAEAVDAIETLRRVLYRLLDWAHLDDNESRAIDDDALPALARLDALLSGQATSLEELATWRNEGMRVCGAPGAVPA